VFVAGGEIKALGSGGGAAKAVNASKKIGRISLMQSPRKFRR
jgi:hypothetical protein